MHPEQVGGVLLEIASQTEISARAGSAWLAPTQAFACPSASHTACLKSGCLHHRLQKSISMRAHTRRASRHADLHHRTRNKRCSSVTPCGQVHNSGTKCFACASRRALTVALQQVVAVPAEFVAHLLYHVLHLLRLQARVPYDHALPPRHCATPATSALWHSDRHVSGCCR